MLVPWCPLLRDFTVSLTCTLKHYSHNDIRIPIGDHILLPDQTRTQEVLVVSGTADQQQQQVAVGKILQPVADRMSNSKVLSWNTKHTHSVVCYMCTRQCTDCTLYMPQLAETNNLYSVC